MNKIKDKIVDKVNFNNFGVVFHDAKAIRDFQKKSGMAGPYKVEYQIHYINLVGRLETGNQRLDLAIPMAMFNYYQEVSGAHIEFNGGDVEDKNNEVMALAVKKSEEFQNTKMYEELVNMGFSNWDLVGMNSIHAHPNGINSFSGTDLRADPNHPGICYPLSIGKNISNFASIIQHKVDNNAEIIHTEYRVFNGTADSDMVYEKGRCLTLVRGYEAPKVEQPEPPSPGIIDQMFGTLPPAPAPKKQEESRNKYVLQDGFTGANNAKLKETQDELMELWENCDFKIDTSNIVKKNILRGSGRLQETRKTYVPKGMSWPYERDVKSYQASLFPEEEERKKDNSLPKLSDVNKAIEVLVKDHGYLEEDLMADYSPMEIMETLDIEKYQDEEIEDEPRIVDIENEIIDILVSDKIMSREKLEMLNSRDLIALAEESYGVAIWSQI